MVVVMEKEVILSLGDMEELVEIMEKLSKLCKEEKHSEKIDFAEEVEKRYGIPVFEPDLIEWEAKKLNIVIDDDCTTYFDIILKGE
jgi:hypothetical protein